jgi:hypothetical protein
MTRYYYSTTLNLPIIIDVREWKMFQLSTICHKGFGPKIMVFTYGFTTFIREKFIDSYSLGLRQIAAKLYRSAERNKAYKTIPSLLLPHPSRGRHTSLPPTLSPNLSLAQRARAGGCGGAKTPGGVKNAVGRQMG